MMHPNTEIRFVNDQIGVGVFATKFLPKGTITFVEDKLDNFIAPNNPVIYDPAYAEIIEKYSYTNGNGIRVINWDHAKYMNHCCNHNVLSTGYGFEIAIRDIQAGEQITDEYGLFNLEEEMTLCCENPNCRLVVRPNDTDVYGDEWDEKIKGALGLIKELQQPLAKYIQYNIIELLDRYLETGEDYQSVMILKNEYARNGD